MKNWRINLVLIFICLFAATILGRLFFLQVLNYDYYAALAKGQQILSKNLEGERGDIFFQNQEYPIATTKTYSLVYISPKEIPIEKQAEIARTLSGMLGVNEAVLLEKVQQDSLYELVKERISQTELEELEAAELVGVYTRDENMRYYPYNEFAANILGFVNKEGEGQYGVEEYWDNVLKGEGGFLAGERGPLGYLFLSQDTVSASRGLDIVLTIDYNIQYLAERLLREAEENLQTDGGQIIVIEPASGKILALANSPGFNPNEYAGENDFTIFQNDAIQKIFEPGSVFKPITMAAALDAGKITPQTTYFDPGCYEASGYEVCNYEERIYRGENDTGELTMTNVLEKSINTGAVFAERELGHNNFLKYVEKFGIFEETGIDLWGEISPANTEFKQGREINFATASFGQGIEMTPIQLVRAFCAIANGGTLITPYLVETQFKSTDNVISSQTASKLTAMLVSVVENGFGKAAQVPGYWVAGKTGTAQISYSALDISKEGYSDKTWQSFVGYAPAFDPKFLILVKLNDPATNTAEYSAVPIFQKLAKYIIDYYQIPPDHE